MTLTAPRLILASTSAYRRALLERLGLPFQIEAPGTAETPLADELPTDRAARLALAKAQAVAALYPDAVVIGSDQVAVCAQDVLDKPATAERCRAQLAQLSGTRARFYTACAVLASNFRSVHLDTTVVSVRRLSRAEIERYVQRERPFDCAGGFKVEGLGITLFDSIESDDPTALIGLPLMWLAGALRNLGYEAP